MDVVPSEEPKTIPQTTVLYHGSHGTSRTRGERFRLQGFPTSDGLRGKGFYLWRKSDLWKELAQGWYKFRRSRGEYDGDRNPMGVVIYAVVETPQDRYLDLTDPEAIEQVARLAKIAGMDVTRLRQIGSAYELYISETERDLKTDYVVIEATVGPPSAEFCPEYSVAMLSSPRCYIVRRSEFLKVASTEEFV